MYCLPKESTWELVSSAEKCEWKCRAQLLALHAAPRTESGCESPFRFAERRSSATDFSRRLRIQTLRASVFRATTFCTLHSFLFFHSSCFHFIATESMTSSTLINFYCEWQSEVSAASAEAASCSNAHEFHVEDRGRSVTRFSLSEKANSFKLNSVKYNSFRISIQSDVICKQEHSTRQKNVSQIVKELIKFQLHFTLLKYRTAAFIKLQWDSRFICWMSR